MQLIAVLVLFVLLVVPTHAWAVGDFTPKWPIPDTTGFTVINLDCLDQTVNLNDAIDYLLNFPGVNGNPNGPCAKDRLRIAGGRTVVVTGGDSTVVTPTSSVISNFVVQQRSAAADVYITGILALNGTKQADFIQCFGSPNTNVYLQNIYADIEGDEPGYHGDLVQPTPGGAPADTCKGIYVHNFLGLSNFQGLFCGDCANVGQTRVHIELWDVQFIPQADEASNYAWLTGNTDIPNNTDHPTAILSEFYISDPFNRGVDDLVYPDSTHNSAPPTVAGTDPQVVTWPALTGIDDPVSGDGKVKIGLHPLHPLVPQECVGVAYDGTCGASVPPPTLIGVTSEGVSL